MRFNVQWQDRSAIDALKELSTIGQPQARQWLFLPITKMHLELKKPVIGLRPSSTTHGHSDG